MLRDTNPVRLDELVALSTQTVRRVTPVRKRWQRAVGAENRSTSHRHYTGDVSSPIARAFELMESLATADGCSPWPVLADCAAIVLQADIRRATTDELHTRLAELTDIEHNAEARENRATCSGSYAERAEAGITQVGIELERVAILRELMRREGRS